MLESVDEMIVDDDGDARFGPPLQMKVLQQLLVVMVVELLVPKKSIALPFPLPTGC